MRKGLRIRGNQEDTEVRNALFKFAKWLRSEYEFPIRVPVYLSDKIRILTQDKRSCTASFFAPYDKSAEPYIRIAVGDYKIIKRRYGRDNALASILSSLAHEIVHYRQWLNDEMFCEKQAVRQSGEMVRRYAKSVARP